MKEFRGQALRWEWRDGVVEVALDREPLNEIGTVMLADLEEFAAAIKSLAPSTSACVISSVRPGGFCAGAGGCTPSSPPLGMNILKLVCMRAPILVGSSMLETGIWI